uniref:Putative nlr family card domain protein n=1 Tax=Ixodes ricinus TaxID=34613 RepID=A0A0K8RL68_IXORI
MRKKPVDELLSQYLQVHADPVPFIKHRLNFVQEALEVRGKSLTNACSGGADAECCWIIGEAKIFNTVLRKVCIELCEVGRRGRVGLVYAEIASHGELNNGCIFDACILIHLFLRTHKCIKVVDLVNSITSCGYPTILSDALIYNTNVVELNVSCFRLPVHFHKYLISAIAQMNGLEKLRLYRVIISATQTQGFSQMLFAQTQLRSVEFCANEFSNITANSVMQMLTSNTDSLKILKSQQNALGDEGANALAHALVRESCVLEELSLSNICNFKESQILAIFSSLGDNQSLRTVELYACNLTQFTGLILVKSLYNNKSIEELKLAACNIGCSVPMEFCEMLKVNTTIKDLNLASNHFDIDGAIYMSAALRSNKTLRRLDLSSNDFKTDGDIVLIGALSENSTLQELYLGFVVLTDRLYQALDDVLAYDRVRCHYKSRGAYALSKCIREHASVVTNVYLDSLDNHFHENCFQELCIALCYPSCLQSVYIRANVSINNISANQLKQLMTVTNTLKSLSIYTRSPSQDDLVSILEGLSNNNTIAEFNMTCMCCDIPTTSAFLEMLWKNSTLEQFGTLVSARKELQMIARGLRINTTLKKLRVCNGEYGLEDIMFEIEDLLRRNASICLV